MQARRGVRRIAILAWVVIALGARGQVVWSPLPAPAPPQHLANFEQERQQADALFQAGKVLDALPLYEDLCRQDSTVALFAERHAAGLLAKASDTSNTAQRSNLTVEAAIELRRAEALGDQSEYVRVTLNAFYHTLSGAVLENTPLSPGYTYHGNAQSQAPESAGDSAFAHGNWQQAASLFAQAAADDPAWYQAALFAGDAYFRLGDAANAGSWFAKAIAIDPDRETAYRYWGDTLFRAGDRDGAREKYVEAFVAEPYGPMTIAALRGWVSHTGHTMVRPAITRPEFQAPNGVLTVDPALQASTSDGRSSWLLYQRYRVAHGALTLNQSVVSGSYDGSANLTPKGYRHSIAEEHAALRAMLADIDAKLASGELQEANLDPSIANIRRLEKAGMLGAWIALCAADAGIRSDYPPYRAEHRKHLANFVNAYLIR